jgi:hypothetical protein
VNNEYELSLSRNYVSDWTYIEAIREILQNAIDSNGEMVVDFDNNRLTITNKNCYIDKSTLVLGNTGKKDNREAIGQFGEGYKLALLVLLREGYGIHIKNGGVVWTPEFRMSDTLGCEVLTIKENNNLGNRDLSFVIDGYFDKNELYEEFPILKQKIGINPYDFKETDYGEIITDPEYAGKMYVGGLYVDSFDFKYGYNFKPQYVKLDRDRKSINIYELRNLTTLALSTMKEADIEFLDEAIDAPYDDAKKFQDKISELNNDLIINYSDYLYEKLGAPEQEGKQVAYVPGSSKEVIKEIENSYDDVVVIKTNNVTQAKVINYINNASNRIVEEASRRVKAKSDIDNAWDYYNSSEYKGMLEWMDVLLNNYDIDESYISDFADILEDLEPMYFYKIRDKVKDGYTNIFTD